MVMAGCLLHPGDGCFIVQILRQHVVGVQCRSENTFVYCWTPGVGCKKLIATALHK